MDDYESLFRESDDLLRAKLVTETALIEWRTLQVHFAGGKVIHVADGHDLVEMAFIVSRDDAGALRPLMESGAVAQVANDDARRWYDADAMVWAVIARPWILVQDEAGRNT
jgi:hypothetical protein